MASWIWYGQYKNNPAFQMIAAAGPTSVSDEVTQPKDEIGFVEPSGEHGGPWEDDPSLKYTSQEYVDAWNTVFQHYQKGLSGSVCSLSHGNALPIWPVPGPNVPLRCP